MIKIQNIYYMLSYAFQTLREQGYKDVATEEFHNTADLCSSILIKGVSLQVKRGLGREYIPETEILSGIKGKIDISESIKTQSLLRRQMVCSYDDLSTNTYMNRIIKTTMIRLLYSDIDKTRKKELKNLLVFFSDMDELDVNTITWKQHYNRSNETYRMLISICFLVLKGLLQAMTYGKTRLMDFIDEQRMCRLYEKFILEYYKAEFPALKAESSEIKWMLDDDNYSMLPIMKSDITLSYNNKVLIIDAKYYAHATQVQFDKHTIHSGNLYQIFTYVKNKEAELKSSGYVVAGMLLYAKTDEDILPDNEYRMSGNTISVRTLDLSGDFSRIDDQLKRIVNNFFGDEISEGRNRTKHH
ncbi:MAG: 5-methylcytosine-specific restriction endonuclease system specificity protein McrC [Candidatus Ornithospirochaeta sp.]